jgi:hypothetical protein
VIVQKAKINHCEQQGAIDRQGRCSIDFHDSSYLEPSTFGDFIDENVIFNRKPTRYCDGH